MGFYFAVHNLVPESIAPYGIKVADADFCYVSAVFTAACVVGHNFNPLGRVITEHKLFTLALFISVEISRNEHIMLIWCYIHRIRRRIKAVSRPEYLSVRSAHIHPVI